MARMLSTVLVVALLAGTAGAFAVTERLKVVRSPIADTRIERKVFSPVCDCPKAETAISFDLRQADRLTVAIVDSGGDVVRTLLDEERVAAGAVEIPWDGRGEGGEVVPEGAYRPRVRLHGERRTIVLPNPIRVDTTPPPAPAFEVTPTAFSPDGDGRNDKVSVRYRVEEPARGLVFVDGERRVRSRFQRLEDKLDWYGKVDGEPLPPGTYAVSMAAEDPAGNVSERTGPVPVEIRYVGLGRDSVTVPAAVRFGIRVLADAERVRWRFAGGTGTAPPGLLVLRAPRRPGEYTLFVEVDGRAARAAVTVVARDR